MKNKRCICIFLRLSAKKANEKNEKKNEKNEKKKSEILIKKLISAGEKNNKKRKKEGKYHLS